VHSSTSRSILVSLSAILLTSLLFSDLTSHIDLFKSDNTISTPSLYRLSTFVFRHSPLPCRNFSPSLAPMLGTHSPFPPWTQQVRAFIPRLLATPLLPSYLPYNPPLCHTNSHAQAYEHIHRVNSHDSATSHVTVGWP
jgi:hypothetical protein